MCKFTAAGMPWHIVLRVLASLRGRYGVDADESEEYELRPRMMPSSRIARMFRYYPFRRGGGGANFAGVISRCRTG